MRGPGLSARNRNGFTLVEVLIASLILAILVVGIGFFFGYIIKQSDVMDDKTQALELARQGLENLRTMELDTVPDGTIGPEVLEKFSRYFIVSSPFTMLSTARLVQCRVVWVGAQGADTLSLSTVF